MLATNNVRPVRPQVLKALLGDGEELALIDVREELLFSQGHLLLARCAPLSRLELNFATLVPRRGTRIVLSDDDNDLVERAAAILADAGYSELSRLEGGVAAWAAAGFPLFSGINVPSKAFGEHVEHASATPSIDADELARLMREQADVVVLDSRPFDEYQRVSIPTAVNVPGAELVLRARDLAPSPETLVVVNCAGRTRSIIGAQSLIDAGLPNKVVALRNGTMGWTLAGFTCEHGMVRRAPPPSRAALAWGKSAAEELARRHGVPRIGLATLERWRAECERRTLYVFDVRDPEEYAAGHLAGAISAPGGQLVQASDQYIGTLGARIVLVDELEVRALMTAAWLTRMGYRDVSILAASGSEQGFLTREILGPAPPPELRIALAALAHLIARDESTVIDLSLSREYRKAHIPGAWFAIRSRLDSALAKIPVRGTLVLSSEDGVLAGLAAREARALTEHPVRWLNGGNAAWAASGRPLTADEPRFADDVLDSWLKPYERGADSTTAMRDYLNWELNLLAEVARDGSLAFAGG